MTSLVRKKRRQRSYAPRCETPNDPRWRKPVDPPQFDAELDLERPSGVRDRFDDFGQVQVPQTLDEDEQ